MNRRCFLAGSAGLVVTGCGDTSKLNQQTKAVVRRSVAVDYASYYAPYQDVRRLMQARAATAGARLTVSDDPSGSAAQVANLRRWTGPSGGFRAVAVVPFDVGAVEPVVARAVGRGTAIVAFVEPIARATATIRVDRAKAGAVLAQQAPDGGVVVVAPPRGGAVPDPFAAGFDATARAIAGVRDVRATVTARAQDDAAAALRAVLEDGDRAILCWNDQTALGAASVAGDRWVGGLGAPWISSADALRALHRGTLDLLVAPRLRDLAWALVDVPFALVRGRTVRDLDVELAVLGPRSRELRAFRSDFAA